MQTYGLIGKTLKHSFSADYFTKFFREENIAARYINYEIDDIGLIKKIAHDDEQLMGFNITIPYKQSVIPLLDSVSTSAAAIGAVNVVKIVRNGAKPLFEGYNTDYIGFTKSISPLLRPYHRKALILGSGGAARCAAYALEKKGIRPTIVSRKTELKTYDSLSADDYANNTVIVNCTPLGMYPHTDTCPPIDYSQLGEHHLCFDMVYNPDSTLFLRKSSARGAVTKNGLEMLYIQANESWKIWQQQTIAT